MESHAASLTGSIFSDLLIVFVLVLANSFFVASEFALVSARKTRIVNWQPKGAARRRL